VARIAGVNIPTGKRVPIALTYITGIGSHIAEQICAANNIDRARRVNDLTDAEVLAIREYIGLLAYRLTGRTQALLPAP